MKCRFSAIPSCSLLPRSLPCDRDVDLSRLSCCVALSIMEVKRRPHRYFAGYTCYVHVMFMLCSCLFSCTPETSGVASRRVTPRRRSSGSASLWRCRPTAASWGTRAASCTCEAGPTSCTWRRRWRSTRWTTPVVRRLLRPPPCPPRGSLTGRSLQVGASPHDRYLCFGGRLCYAACAL